MAASLPVVAYSVGGNVELVSEQTGTLINPRNENEFAAAIVRFLSDAGLRRDLGASARRFVEQNFGLDQVRRRYEDLYVSLLDRKGRRKQA